MALNVVKCLYVCLGFVLLLSLIKNADGGHVYCHRRLTGYDTTGIRPKSFLQTLNSTGKPCTYFDGNLVIVTRINEDNSLNDPNLKLLFNSIRVVTGFVYIHIAGKDDELRLDNLRIIYGRELFPYGGRKYSFLVNHERGDPFPSLSFGSLRAIENGNVGFIDTYFCDINKRVAWQEILSNSETQSFFYNTTECPSEDFPDVNCSSTCPFINGAPRCWGSQPHECQQRTRCHKRGWKYCYYTKNDVEELCYEECVGGCYGSGEDQCVGCAQYMLNDTCVSTCPYGMLILDRICVNQCPENMVIDGNACVNQCPPGFVTKNSSIICEPCPPTGCHDTVCKLLDESQYHSDLDYVNLKTLTNCTILQGSLLLSGKAWPNPEKGIPGIASVKELEALENLQVVTGIVHLDFGRKFQAESLYFLRRLREIQGQFRGAVHRRQALLVASIDIAHLGLQSLQLVNGDVVFMNTPKLKYAMTANWTKLGAPRPALLYGSLNKDLMKIQATCDPQCHPEWGCVGPGPAMCVRCVAWKASQHLCVTNCTDISGYYTPSEMKDSSLIEKKQCGACSSECAERCHGPDPNQCIGPCKNYRYGDVCVPKCPHYAYANETSKTCHRCSTDCHNRGITQKPVCYGPSSSDCNKCNVLLYDSQERMNCRPISQHCPTSYYNTIVSHQKSSSGLLQYVEEGDVMEVCYPCSPPCVQCSSSTECQDCAGVWLHGKCLKDCPLEIVPLRYRNVTIPTNTSCITCNENCQGGCSDIGPTNCNACRSFSLKIKDGNSSKLECVAKCPEKSFANDRGLCILEEETSMGHVKRLLTIIFAVAVPVLLVAIAVLVVCALLAWKRKSQFREEKERIQDIFSNAYDNTDAMNNTMETRSINLSRLEFIQSDELNMDSSKLLGSGAFGEVFKADWTVSEEKLQKRVSEYGVNSPWISNFGTTFFRTSTLRSATLQRQRQIEVAVKRISALTTSSDQATRDEVFAEAQVMASVKHPNCLPLIGICMSQGYLITAFMPKGSLDRYLATNREYLDVGTMFLWSQQIADGMSYLTQQGIIHRDLATRNVLLKDHDWAMITDFGLSKMLESESQKEVVIVAGRVPIRWLAVETLRHGIYSAATDVWSFGVTVWEIFSFAEMPYGEMETLAVRDYVLSGGRLNQPTGLSDSVYLEMYKCWADDSENRPTFTLLKMKFKAFGQCAQDHYVNPFRRTEAEGDAPFLRETNRSRKGRHHPKKLYSDKYGAYPPSSLGSSTGYTDMSQALSVNFDKPKITRYENIPEEQELQQLQQPLLEDPERCDFKETTSIDNSPYPNASATPYLSTPLNPKSNQYC